MDKKNVLILILVIVSQLFDYIKSHYIVHFTVMNCIYVNYILIIELC